VRRREFITLLGGAAAAGPLAARAQQQTVALVGLLTGSGQDDRWLGALRQGLKETGYIEGRNLAIKHRSADGHFDRVPALAAELVADPAALIIAIAPSAALAAKAATSGQCRPRHGRGGLARPVGAAGRGMTRAIRACAGCWDNRPYTMRKRRLSSITRLPCRKVIGMPGQRWHAAR
jgi:hypothetical protein